MGSTEVQVAQLTARVEQLTVHLQAHRKDYATRLGLVILLGQRRRLMKYLYDSNRCGSALVTVSACAWSTASERPCLSCAAWRSCCVQAMS